MLLIAAMMLVPAGIAAQNADADDPFVPREEVVLQWNRVLAETLAIPGLHPATIRTQRSYAMMHLAIFDAVNSIEGRYHPYLTYAPIKHASTRAAAAYAAHNLLVALYPTRQSVFDVELAESLKGISPATLARGRVIGELCAGKMFRFRENDGWNVAPPPFVLPPTPGNWQPTPPSFSPARLTHFPGVIPFAMAQGTQFLPIPPPDLSTSQYAEELNEVKSLGASNSTTRTPNQTLTARLWESGSKTEVLLNNLVRDLSESHALSTPQNARLFALYYMAMHDALQTASAAQYTYGRWRPITAIRRADEDGNPDTEQDANWNSLLNAPANPAYSSNASALTSSPATTLALFFGRDDIQFQINFGGTPNVVRTYQSFSAMTNEAALSRIYSGIHYRSDLVAGQAAGRNLATYVFLNFLEPRERKSW